MSSQILHRLRAAVAILLAVLCLAATACSDSITAESTETASDAFDMAAIRSHAVPSLKVVSPADGATVRSPFTLDVEATNIRLAPKGAVRDGEAHLHVLVLGGCVEPGEVIIDDPVHVHFGSGSDELELDLPPGDYELCVQAGDGFHVALGIAANVSVSVIGSQDADSKIEPLVEHDHAEQDQGEDHDHAEHDQGEDHDHAD